MAMTTTSSPELTRNSIKTVGGCVGAAAHHTSQVINLSRHAATRNGAENHETLRDVRREL